MHSDPVFEGLQSFAETGGSRICEKILKLRRTPWFGGVEPGPIARVVDTVGRRASSQSFPLRSGFVQVEKSGIQAATNARVATAAMAPNGLSQVIVPQQGGWPWRVASPRASKASSTSSTTRIETLFRSPGSLPTDLVEIPLEENVRNTRLICREVSRHYSGEVSIRPRGPARQKVLYHAYRGLDDLASLLGRTIHHLLTTEALANSDMVVLTTRASVADSSLFTLQLPHGIRLAAEEPRGPGRAVFCCSISEFKGLERKVALVAEVDEFLPANPKVRDALLYVGFSRPRHHLVVFHSAAAQCYLGIAVPALAGGTLMILLSDLAINSKLSPGRTAIDRIQAQFGTNGFGCHSLCELRFDEEKDYAWLTDWAKKLTPERVKLIGWYCGVLMMALFAEIAP